ncbi:YbhB/YbcL family Raf kinase inhibitor-like protein [Sphingomonas morindae]|uniref:YbhB/YbcL family Raf kinase inhibitor-like protein n=1 Tax=Sphingomonas morindae TaxID=1541170 RepID=A0ABY4X681_9SPHN|nr:YbhB/YbcL family Raf kinase inhibitor-like protein [Sphingomonas morindae]USI72402.1 YbhB/YbcL family Raf kinase inhibitor-like protein [Sphingomonas morindae]
MLEHIPAWLGSLLRGARAGHDSLVIADPRLALGAVPAVTLGSPAFAQDGRLPPRFTADGEGVSPPLLWHGVPDATAALALIVEDPDAPAARPLVHALVWGMDPGTAALAEGALDGSAMLAGGAVGRNSALRRGWLPPDPPTGHGTHDYVFQLFALSERVDLGEEPGRSACVEALAGRVLAAGALVGCYSRGEPAAIGPAGAPALAPE